MTEAAYGGRLTRSTGTGVAVMCPAHPYCLHQEAADGPVAAAQHRAKAAMKRHLETDCEGVQALSRM